MQNSKLQLEIIKSDKNKFYLCILPKKYITPIEYIEDLIDQLRKDIFPLFSTKGAAPFTVLRNTFCVVDHVSKLIYNSTSSQTKRMKKLLCKLSKFDSFINTKYRMYSSYIVQIYRHDLVHNVRPLPKIIKIIEKNNNKTSNVISWFAISSEIHYTAPKDFDSLKNYIKNTKNRKNLGHLRYIGNQIFINNYCMFFDLINFLEEYKDSLSKDKNLQETFAKNYENIVRSNLNKIENFVLDKNKDKEVKIL